MNNEQYFSNEFAKRSQPRRAFATSLKLAKASQVNWKIHETLKFKNDEIPMNIRRPNSL